MKQNLMMCALVTSAMVFTGGCGQYEKSEQEILTSAHDYLDQDKPKAALVEIKNLLQKSPSHPEARHLLGSIYLEYGDFAGAEDEFQRVVESGDEPGPSLIGLAESLLKQNKAEKLLRDINIDVSDATLRADLIAYHAAAKILLNAPEEAGRLLDQAEADDSNAYQVLRTKAALQVFNNDFRAAKSTIDAAKKVYGNDQGLMLDEAKILLATQQVVPATEVLQRTIDIDPPEIMTAIGREARVLLASLLLEKRDVNQAKLALEPVIKNGGNNPNEMYLSAVIAFLENENEEARKTLNKIINNVPDYTPAQLLMGSINYAERNYDQARYFLEKYLAKVPGNVSARKMLGTAYMHLGKYGDATSTFSSSEGSNKDVELLALAGLSELRLGHTDSGLKALKDAVGLNPRNEELKKDLIKAYISIGDTDSALKELEVMFGGEDSEAANELLILTYLKSGDYGKALDTVKELISAENINPMHQVLAGYTYAANNQFEKAKQSFRAALSDKPEITSAAITLSQLEFSAGDMEAAKSTLLQAVKANPDAVSPLLALASLSMRLGDEVEVLKHLEKARSIDKSDVSSRLALSNYYLRSSMVQKAKEYLKEIEGIAPENDVNVLLLQARILMLEERFNEAVRPLNTATGLVDDSPEPFALLAENYIRLNQMDKAKRYLEQALAIDESYYPAEMLMAEVYFRTGDFEEALDIGHRIVASEVDGVRGHEIKGRALMGMKAYGDAFSEFLDSLEAQPRAGVLVYAIEALQHSGQFLEKLPTIESHVQMYSDDVAVLRAMGFAYQHIGKNDEAIEQYESLIKSQSDDFHALNNLAWLYFLNDDPRALQLAEKAYRLSPEHPGVIDTYGWILVNDGRAQEGLRLLKSALESLSEIPEVRYHYAVALYRTGNKDEALALLRSLIDEVASFEGRKDAEQLLAEK